MAQQKTPATKKSKRSLPTSDCSYLYSKYLEYPFQRRNPPMWYSTDLFVVPIDWHHEVFDISSPLLRTAVLILASSFHDGHNYQCKYFAVFFRFANDAIRNQDCVALVHASYYVPLIAGPKAFDMTHDWSRGLIHLLKFARAVDAFCSFYYHIPPFNELKLVEKRVHTVFWMAWTACGVSSNKFTWSNLTELYISIWNLPGMAQDYPRSV